MSFGCSPCSFSFNSPCGACPPGPVGPPGPPGTSSVLINNTVFVDPQFGNNGTGVVENMVKPFQTLSAANSAAIASASPTDKFTVYIQPGTYTETNLVLNSNVMWYFSEGGFINTPTGTVFTDSAGVANTEITGWGNFTSNTVLTLNNASTVNFTAQSVNSVGNGFNLSGSSVVKITTRFLNSGVGSMINVVGNSTINVEFQQFSGSALLANVNSTASGALNLLGEQVTGISSGIILLSSNNFTLNTQINQLIFTPSSPGVQALQVNVATPSATQLTCLATFNIGQINSSGGVLLVQGPSGNPSTNLTSPQVNLNVIYLSVSGSIQPFQLSSAQVNIGIDVTFIGNVTTVTNLYNVQDNITLNLTGKYLLTSFTTPTNLNFMNASGNGIILDVKIDDIFLGGGLITTSTNVTLTFTANTITLNLTSISTPPIQLGFPFVINTEIINIFNVKVLLIVGSFAPDVTTDMIQLNSGIYDIIIETYEYFIPNTVGIHQTGQNTAMFLTLDAINSSANNTTLIVTETSTSTTMKIGSVSAEGTGANAILIQGQTSVNILMIFVPNDGYGVSVTGSGELDGFISNINTNTGSALMSTSTGDIELMFNEFNTTGSGGTVGSVINLQGLGDNWLTGNQISANNCQYGIYILSPPSETDNTAMSLRVNNFFSNTVFEMVHIENAGNVTIDIQDCRINGCTNGFNIINSIVEIRGTAFSMNTTVAGSFMFLVTGTTEFESNITDVEIVSRGGAATFVNHTNVGLYTCERTIVNDTMPVININTNLTIGNGDYYFGGYLKTAGSSAITITLVGRANLPVVRITRGILIATTFSISGTVGTPCPVTIQPISSNVNYDNTTISLHPAVPIIPYYFDGSVR